MRVDIHVHLHGPININVSPSDEVPAWAEDILEALVDIGNRLGQVQQEVETMDHNIDELTADVADESTQIDGLSTLTANIKKALDDALAGTTIAPAVQAKINGIFDSIETNKAKVVAAINANTPAASVPVPGA